ncbi:MAG: DUF5615 family PIN-like protein [Gemmataceae bacterium]|nr:DUF5615 family PIN-like protein [Gemmataceae bacterium]MCI0741495.1 DUF5615 family PIN-like protein [Gemmataceae bacterium]
MTLLLYMDAHVHRGITEGLRIRQVDVLTVQGDQRSNALDPEILQRATDLGRVLFTQDEDLLREGSLWQQSGKSFAGIIYVHQLKMTIGQIIADLELMAKVYDPADMLNRVEYLPL